MLPHSASVKSATSRRSPNSPPPHPCSSDAKRDEPPMSQIRSSLGLNSHPRDSQRPRFAFSQVRVLPNRRVRRLFSTSPKLERVRATERPKTALPHPPPSQRWRQTSCKPAEDKTQSSLRAQILDANTLRTPPLKCWCKLRANQRGTNSIGLIEPGRKIKLPLFWPLHQCWSQACCRLLNQKCSCM